MLVDEEELKKYVLNLFNLCYKVKSTQSNRLFWYYDESYIRLKKLNKLNNIELTSPKKVGGVCLFCIDMNYYSNNNMCYYSYNKIWRYLNYNTTLDDINGQNKINKFIYDIISSQIDLYLIGADFTDFDEWDSLKDTNDFIII